MSRVLRTILDFVLPPCCPVTGERVAEPGLLSSKAWEDIRFIEQPFCPICGGPQAFAESASSDMVCALCLEEAPAFDSARSIWAYNDMSAQLVMRFKHGDQLQLARSFLPMLRRGLLTLPAHPSIVVPVPLHRWRLFRRLYNQAAILAQALAKDQPGLTYLPDALIRVRATKSQGKMDAQSRRKNVRGAFRVPDKKRDLIKGKNVLLIDDVFTTGATLRECASALKRAGASRVDALTVARVVKN